MRRATAAIAFVLSVASGIAPAAADPIADFYAGKTLRLVVGGSTGGGYDAVGRLQSDLAEQLFGNISEVRDLDGQPASGILRLTKHVGC